MPVSPAIFFNRLLSYIVPSSPLCTPLILLRPYLVSSTLIFSSLLFSSRVMVLLLSSLLFYSMLFSYTNPTRPPHLPLLSTMYVLPCVLLCCVLFCTITYIILSFLRIRFRLYTPPMPPIHTLLHPQFANYQKVRSARQFLCDVVFCSLSLLLCYSSSPLCITLP